MGDPYSLSDIRTLLLLIIKCVYNNMYDVSEMSHKNIAVWIYKKKLFIMKIYWTIVYLILYTIDHYHIFLL